MHITYDLPVAIDDIIEAKQRLAGRIYKTGMPRSNYFSERCKGEIFLSLKICSVRVHLKFVAHLIN
ncbi:catabolic threonine dehydratase [Escherichia coli]|uniref:Catabolic threonine dehydratase n=1 Tax=Escherichia coli TaxID=562 RepID=A0A376TSI5_ECOLX|nr:catabolic threonine dehydratase [Escherichia coli]